MSNKSVYKVNLQKVRLTFRRIHFLVETMSETLIIKLVS